MENARSVLDLDKLAIDIGVPYSVIPSPDGGKRYDTGWDVVHMVKAVDEIKKLVNEYEEMDVCGGGPHWLLAAAVCAAYPRLKAYVIPGLPVRAEFESLGYGEASPEGGIEFKKTVAGNKVFIEFRADDPDKPPIYGPHNYDRSLLPKVTVPNVKENDDLYLKGQGEFSIIMNIVNMYCGKCKSINVAGTGVNGYVCVYSADDANRAIGDITRFPR